MDKYNYFHYFYWIGIFLIFIRAVKGSQIGKLKRL
jgi:hypothetical protein